MKISYQNKAKIKNEIERICGIKLNKWYFKDECKSLKIGYWLTDTNKIAIRFMEAGEQSEKVPSLPKHWSLPDAKYYQTLAGTLKRIKKHYATKFEGYVTFQQQIEAPKKQE